MSFGLAGKTIFVTGASSGLGAHFANCFAREGANVVLAARRVGHLAEIEAGIRKHDVRTLCVELDVSDQNSISQAVADAEVEFGAIDVLVNNAGIAATGLAISYEASDFDRVLDVNLRGAFFMAQAVAKRMVNQGGGSIINIASVLGIRQTNTAASYAISKAAVIQMTKVLALEWARHAIRVNAIAPGYFNTEMNESYLSTESGMALIKRIPQRRLGNPAELEGPLLLLASDLSSYMTGSIVVVDGGLLVSSL
jgi:NAD(P)-dependent dehydrogenase (short-subunit alcohol dehydrogenase family)